MVRIAPRTARQAFRQAVGRDPGRVPYATLQPATPAALPQAALFHYWHPDRDGIEKCPEHIRRQLHRIHPSLACVRPPANAPVASRAWAVWYRKPEITHPLSPGWMLFFVWQERTTTATAETGTVDTLRPLSLDDPRLIANIFRFSVFGDVGSAGEHFKRVVKAMQGERDAATKEDRNHRDDLRKDYWQSTKIKNIGSGSKFARHHDGSVVPSRGEQNWLADRGTRDLPAPMAAAEQDKQRQRTSRLRERRKGRG